MSVTEQRRAYNAYWEKLRKKLDPSGQYSKLSNETFQRIVVTSQSDQKRIRDILTKKGIRKATRADPRQFKPLKEKPKKLVLPKPKPSKICREPQGPKWPKLFEVQMRQKIREFEERERLRKKQGISIVQDAEWWKLSHPNLFR